MEYFKCEKPTFVYNVWQAVRHGSLAEIERALSLEKLEKLPIDILVFACRFRGPQAVKRLAPHIVERHAVDIWGLSIWVSVVEHCNSVTFTHENVVYTRNHLSSETLSLVSAKERVDSILWLQEEKYIPQDRIEALLVFSILLQDLHLYEELKHRGVSLSDTTIDYVKNGVGGLWREVLLTAEENDLCSILSELNKELSKNPKLPLYKEAKQHISEFHNEESIRLLISSSDSKFFRKGDYVAAAIQAGDLQRVVTLAECGWFKNRKLRDQAIKYASSCRQVEIVTWLLDYKNRTADLELERRLDEQRAARELAASPTSVLALRKLWTFQVLDDNTLKITKYKGDQIEVTIPERIGHRVVSAIGTNILRDAKNVSVIKVPDTVTRIDSFAFAWCKSLTCICLPEALSNLGDWVAIDCEALQIIATRSTMSRALERYEKIKAPVMFLPGTIKGVGVCLIANHNLAEIHLGEGTSRLYISSWTNTFKCVYLPVSLQKFIIFPHARKQVQHFFRFIVAKGSKAEYLCEELGLSYQYNFAVD